VGANIEEAYAGFSKPDFTHSMNIARKEARETAYWLKLLKDSGILADVDLPESARECNELVSILTAIVKTSQTRP